MTTDAKLRRRIAHWFGLDLPGSIEDVRWQTEAGMDRLILFRFRIPAGEVDAVLDDLEFTEGLVAGYRPFHSEDVPAVGWWNPDAEGDVRGNSVQTENRAVAIMVADGGSDATVYGKVMDL